MSLTRRETLILGAGAAALAITGFRSSPVLASAEDTQAKIMEFTGGKEPATGRITLNAPEIAENGNTVPVSVSVDSPMTDDDYVEAVMVLAEGNPNPGVIVFAFTPLSGSAEAATRMRLAKTQNVVAIAKMKDGSVFKDTREVKVTIGGCGG